MTLFTLFLVGHVLLPVLDTFLKPLFHEARIPLELINLSSSDFLLVAILFVVRIIFVALSLVSLTICLNIELLQVRFHVGRLLRLVKRL